MVSAAISDRAAGMGMVRMTGTFGSVVVPPTVMDRLYHADLYSAF